MTCQETIDNIQTNYINSLIFLSEDVSTIDINGEEVLVNKESKVYIVISTQYNLKMAPPSPDLKGLKIPDHVKADYLFLTFEEDEDALVADLINDLQMVHSGDKY